MVREQIIALVDELIEKKQWHTEYVEYREENYKRDPEDERYMRYDEDLEEAELDIEEIQSKILDLVSSLAVTKEW
jgi:hypothetical protein